MLTFFRPIALLLASLSPVFTASAQAQPAAVQETLTEIIGELADNEVVDARYSELLAAEIKRQRDFIVPTLTTAGPLNSLTLMETTHPTPGQQVDRFLAEHENTSFVWTISRNDAGVVTLLVLAPPSVPATPEEKRTALAGATLTEIIGELRDGEVEASRYSDALTEEIERQRDIILPSLVAAGPLTTLKFLNATRTGSGQPISQFLAEHEDASFLWTISMNRNDVITLLLVQPGG